MSRDDGGWGLLRMIGDLLELTRTANRERRHRASFARAQYPVYPGAELEQRWSHVFGVRVSWRRRALPHWRERSCLIAFPT